jgi:predicted nucleic acid-binding protein
MRADVFCDTNILLYAVSKASEEAAKREIARECLALPGVGFSTQVLQEFYVNATQKRAIQLSRMEALAIITKLRRFPIWPVTTELVFRAVDL